MDDARTAEKPKHPIAVVAERTRLSPDVLRVWERRYQIVAPERGTAGQRLYSDADVEKLTLLHQAVSAGRNIGQLADASIESLRNLVREDSDARRARMQDNAASRESENEIREAHIDPVFRAIDTLDSLTVEALLRRSASVLGIPVFVERVAAPLCRRVGDEWHAGLLTAAQEHLTTAALQRVIATSMASMSVPDDAPAIVIGTPSGERHEIGAMLASAKAMACGWRVVYLGADLAPSEIAVAAGVSSARAVALSVVYVTDKPAVVAQLKDLRSQLPYDVRLIAGGAAALAIAAELEAIGVVIASAPAVLRGELALARATLE